MNIVKMFWTKHCRFSCKKISFKTSNNSNVTFCNSHFPHNIDCINIEKMFSKNTIYILKNLTSFLLDQYHRFYSSLLTLHFCNSKIWFYLFLFAQVGQKLLALNFCTIKNLSTCFIFVYLTCTLHSIVFPSKCFIMKSCV